MRTRSESSAGDARDSLWGAAGGSLLREAAERHGPRPRSQEESRWGGRGQRQERSSTPSRMSDLAGAAPSGNHSSATRSSPHRCGLAISGDAGHDQHTLRHDADQSPCPTPTGQGRPSKSSTGSRSSAAPSTPCSLLYLPRHSSRDSECRNRPRVHTVLFLLTSSHF